MIPDAPWRVVIVSQVPRVAAGYAEFIRSIGHEPVAHLAARFPPTIARRPQAREFASRLLFEAPQDIDLVYPGGRQRIAPVLRAYEPDLLLCTAFPWRIPAEALAVPRIGCVNGHPSLLPRFRGPTPVAWAIRSGETRIGFTYHLMDEQFDTGPILAQGSVPLDDDESMETLWPKVGTISDGLLATVFERLASGDRGDPQEGGDYQSLFEAEYVSVDPTGPRLDVHTQVRAWRFAFSSETGERGPILELDGERVRLLRTSLTEVEDAERLDCADGPLWIVETDHADG